MPNHQEQMAEKQHLLGKDTIHLEMVMWLLLAWSENDRWIIWVVFGLSITYTLKKIVVGYVTR